MSRRHHLSDLLRDLFTAAEVRRIAEALPGGDELAASLPGGNSSLAELADLLPGMLEQRNLIDARLFALLADKRPRQRERIAQVAREWEVSLAEHGHAVEADDPGDRTARQPGPPGLGAVIPAPSRWRWAGCASILLATVIIGLVSLRLGVCDPPTPEPSSGSSKPLAPLPPPPAPPAPLVPPPGMRLVPAGKFEMGSTDWSSAHRACADAYGAEHCIEAIFKRQAATAGSRMVTAFFLDEREVSLGQFADWLAIRYRSGELRLSDDGEFLTHEGTVWARLHWPLGPTRQRAEPRRISAFELDPRDGLRAASGSETLPAYLLTWWAARAYCEAQGKRLPTEVEWEYAARGPRSMPYPLAPASPGGCDAFVYGRENIVPGSAVSECKTRPGRPEAVGTSPHDVSWCDIRDLAGNVSEWVADAYVDKDPAAAPIPCVEHAGSDDDSVRECRIVKGGSWTDPRMFAQAAGRFVMDATPTKPAQVRAPQARAGRVVLAPSVGFRCAMDTPSPSSPEP